MAKVKAYLDTCVVSGLAKAYIGTADIAALQRILEAREVGALDLVTSELTQQELNHIPAKYRLPHSTIYSLLTHVPLAPEHRLLPPFTPAPMFRREDALLTSLSAILPDAKDAAHAFQAVKNSADFLITVDYRTFRSHAAEVERLCGLRIVGPSEVVQLGWTTS